MGCSRGPQVNSVSSKQETNVQAHRKCTRRGWNLDGRMRNGHNTKWSIWKHLKQMPSPQQAFPLWALQLIIKKCVLWNSKHGKSASRRKMFQKASSCFFSINLWTWINYVRIATKSEDKWVPTSWVNYTQGCQNHLFPSMVSLCSVCGRMEPILNLLLQIFLSLIKIYKNFKANNPRIFFIVKFD